MKITHFVLKMLRCDGDHWSLRLESLLHLCAAQLMKVGSGIFFQQTEGTLNPLWLVISMGRIKQITQCFVVFVAGFQPFSVCSAPFVTEMMWLHFEILGLGPPTVMVSPTASYFQWARRCAECPTEIPLTIIS